MEEEFSEVFDKIEDMLAGQKIYTLDRRMFIGDYRVNNRHPLIHADGRGFIMFAQLQDARHGVWFHTWVEGRGIAIGQLRYFKGELDFFMKDDEIQRKFDINLLDELREKYSYVKKNCNKKIYE
jgi:hypothetical protein